MRLGKVTVVVTTNFELSFKSCVRIISVQHTSKCVVNLTNDMSTLFPGKWTHAYGWNVVWYKLEWHLAKCSRRDLNTDIRRKHSLVLPLWRHPGGYKDCLIEYNQWCHAFHSLGTHLVTPIWSIEPAKLEARLFTILLLNKNPICSIRAMSQITNARV